MSPKLLTTFRVAPDLMAGMRAIKDRDGVPMSVQLDRALRAWLQAKGAGTKAASRRVSPRRKA
jgi:hypothetical protein